MVLYQGVVGTQKINTNVKEILTLKLFNLKLCNKSWKIVSLELGHNKGSIRELSDKPEGSHPSEQSVQGTVLVR